MSSDPFQCSGVPHAIQLVAQYCGGSRRTESSTDDAPLWERSQYRWAVRAIRRLTVHPVLPAALEPLKELALNLRWAWHRDTQLLFRAVDPELWDEMGPDPTRLLGRVSPSRLAELAEDTTFVRNVERAARDLEDYLSADLWYQRQARAEALHGIGYFSAECGITEALPQ